MNAGRDRPGAEFVALMALLFATIALSIDAMLPALPEIATALSPDAPNRAQLVVTSFVLGMGIGTLFAGPLSDRFGRRAVILAGMALYLGAALACWLAPSLEVLLAARLLQGLGAAAPRTVSMAIVRDLHSGTTMARLLSFVMMVFTLVPAIAPLMGQAVMALAGWQGIFLAYALFATLISGWFWARQPETLPPARRRPLSPATLVAATREVLSHRIVVLAILAQTLTLGMLFATLSSIQGIFALAHGEAARFPLWFGLIALLSMSGSLFNARFVRRVGMQRMLRLTYGAQAAVTGLMLAVTLAGVLTGGAALGAQVLWFVGLFAMMGVTNGNLSAIAMEPLGHVAGLAASLISSIATVGSVLLAVPVGLAFDGSAVPLLAGVTVFALLAWTLARAMQARD